MTDCEPTCVCGGPGHNAWYAHLTEATSLAEFIGTYRRFACEGRVDDEGGDEWRRWLALFVHEQLEWSSSWTIGDRIRFLKDVLEYVQFRFPPECYTHR